MRPLTNAELASLADIVTGRNFQVDESPLIFHEALPSWFRGIGVPWVPSHGESPNDTVFRLITQANQDADVRLKLLDAIDEKLVEKWDEKGLESFRQIRPSCVLSYEGPRWEGTLNLADIVGQAEYFDDHKILLLSEAPDEAKKQVELSNCAVVILTIGYTNKDNNRKFLAHLKEWLLRPGRTQKAAVIVICGERARLWWEAFPGKPESERVGFVTDEPSEDEIRKTIATLLTLPSRPLPAVTSVPKSVVVLGAADGNWQTKAEDQINSVYSALRDRAPQSVFRWKKDWHKGPSLDPITRDNLLLAEPIFLETVMHSENALSFHKNELKSKLLQHLYGNAWDDSVWQKIEAQCRQFFWRANGDAWGGEEGIDEYASSDGLDAVVNIIAKLGGLDGAFCYEALSVAGDEATIKTAMVHSVFPAANAGRQLLPVDADQIIHNADKFSSKALNVVAAHDLIDSRKDTLKHFRDWDFAIEEAIRKTSPKPKVLKIAVICKNAREMWGVGLPDPDLNWCAVSCPKANNYLPDAAGLRNIQKNATALRAEIGKGVGGGVS